MISFAGNIKDNAAASKFKKEIHYRSSFLRPTGHHHYKIATGTPFLGALNTPWGGLWFSTEIAVISETVRDKPVIAMDH